jgi:vacuolar-type H+-ATPase subunit I/STV1
MFIESLQLNHRLMFDCVYPKQRDVSSERADVQASVAHLTAEKQRLESELAAVRQRLNEDELRCSQLVQSEQQATQQVIPLFT